MDMLDLPGAAPATHRPLALSQIEAGPFQLRSQVAPETLETLAQTIRLHGILQPVLVRPLAEDRFELVAGERRWRAACLAGLETVPAIIRPLSDREALTAALIENIQHEALNPLEEAQALARLIRECHLTHQETADTVGRSRSAVSNLLRLLDLSPGVQTLLIEGRLDMGHARALLPLPAADQERLAALIAERGLSAREAERLARAPQADVPPRAATDPRLSQLARELGRALGVRARIRTLNGRHRIVLDCDTEARFAALMTQLAALAADEWQSCQLSPAPADGQASGSVTVSAAMPYSLDAAVQQLGASLTAIARAANTPDDPPSQAADATETWNRVQLANDLDEHARPDDPVAPPDPAIETVPADARVRAEDAARQDQAELAGKAILVSCLLTPDGEQPLDPPAVFQVAPEGRLTLDWQDGCLHPRWQVMSVAPGLSSGYGDAPLWVAGHRYTLDGEFLASRHFSQAIDDLPAPATLPMEPVPVTSEEERSALQYYQQMLGQMVETSEVRGRHHRLGEERVRLIPPVQLRVIDTPPAEILRRQDGVLQPTWRVVPILPDPALDELTDLRMPAPLPGNVCY